MPSVNEMRFTIGQKAYYLAGDFVLTTVTIKTWHQASRGKLVTYTVEKSDGTEVDIEDGTLFHSRAGALSYANEICCSRIAYHQQQINEWEVRRAATSEKQDTRDE